MDGAKAQYRYSGLRLCETYVVDWRGDWDEAGS